MKQSRRVSRLLPLTHTSRIFQAWGIEAQVGQKHKAEEFCEDASLEAQQRQQLFYSGHGCKPEPWERCKWASFVWEGLITLPFCLTLLRSNLHWKMKQSQVLILLIRALLSKPSNSQRSVFWYWKLSIHSWGWDQGAGHCPVTLNILLEMTRFTWNVRTAPSSTVAGLRSCRASRRLSELVAGRVISHTVESLGALRKLPWAPDPH